MTKTIEIAKNAASAANNLRTSSAADRNDALIKISEAITKKKQDIIAANQKDMQAAAELSSALKDRLLLTEERINGMSGSLVEVANQEEVIGQGISKTTRPNGLVVQKVRIPLGVILMIFESRPNVIIDCSALAIKSGNAIILKGGKEAFHSNQILGEIINEAYKGILPRDTVQVIASNKREIVQELLSCKDDIDLVIPRGGSNLVDYVYSNSKIPVIAHFQGLCHTYIDKSANLAQAKTIAINAKTQRTGVCNATETLLVHKDLKGEYLENLIKEFKTHDTKIIADNEIYDLYQALGLDLATKDTWAIEHLDNVLSLKLVDSVEAAIDHINTYGSNHTEAIIAEDADAVEKFTAAIDASCIMHNASTRFNDGGELGLGAELGISTSKIHAYGPMGAAEMTTSRFLVIGNGHIRE